MSVLPVPDLLTMRRILCVQPHPDDGDIGCGGTLARLTEAGAEVIYLTVTDGAAGTDDPYMEALTLRTLRRIEQEDALKTLGIATTKLVWFDEQDGYLKDTFALRDRIILEIRSLRPDCVLTVDPWLPYEAHNDHRVAGLATAQAVFFANTPKIASWSGFSPHPVPAIGFYFTHRPNTFIDVSPYWTRKMSAIQCHKSQFSQQMWSQYEAFFAAQARQWAKGRGYAQAEAFKVLTPQHLHCFPDTEQI
ncbi:PIG-L deacetylase family protein [Anthocerotibacter panamensis]|uniref:PIG-L deacetylase family protein n=1 Tax=Anthocerotibacter panamensis TaxID=2857077 RepID=UPI001C403E20|nr:PIG-L deacetylase family protein [Anthocerotibacter panamensis]